MWTKPKTNWEASDYFNVTDWQRIKSNFEYLLEEMRNMGFTIEAPLETYTGRGYDELPYVHTINNMEKNLATLREISGVSLTEDVAQKTWYDRLDPMYQSNPTYQDWNRWERILLLIHDSIQYIDTYAFTPVSNTCYCGSERTLIRFSRGR